MARPGRKPKLVEFRHVSEGEKMILEIYGEEEEKHVVELNYDQCIFLSDRDIRAHKNDKRFINGLIVAVDSDEDITGTKEANDVMSSERLEAFIKNTNDVEVLNTKIAALKNINTLRRMLAEAKKPELAKSYAFVITLENKINQLVKERDEQFYGRPEDKDEEE